MEDIVAYLLAPVRLDSIPLDVPYLLQLLLLSDDQQSAFQDINGLILQRKQLWNTGIQLYKQQMQLPLEKLQTGTNSLTSSAHCWQKL